MAYNHQTQQQQQRQQPENGFYSYNSPDSTAITIGSASYPSSSRRGRKSSSVAMNVDSPQSSDYHHIQGQQQQQLLSQFPPQQLQKQQASQPDYYPYATTTAQMIDPWTFNHANLLSNLSQLPPGLLPSLIPQQQQQQPLLTAQSMSALAAAAAAASVVPQQHTSLGNVDQSFTVPPIPLRHRDQNMDANNSGGVLPSISHLSHPSEYHRNTSTFAGISQQPQQQQYRGFYYNNPSTIQPLILPPPSPTILSYYSADPTQWMSLMGQHAYQPQAYHYDYPLPPHQLPFNFPSAAAHLHQQQQQQQQYQYGSAQHQANVSALAAAAAVAAAGGSVNSGNTSMLLSQNYASLSVGQQHQPPMQSPYDHQQSFSQNNNMAAAAQIAAAAAAVAGSGQYQTMNNLQYDGQGAAYGSGGNAGYPLSHQQQQAAHHVDDYYQQPTRKSSSFTNLALLQQQLPNSYLKNEYGQSVVQGGASYQNQSSMLSGYQHSALPQQQQQQQSSLFSSTSGRPLRGSRSQMSASGRYGSVTSAFSSTTGARSSQFNSSRTSFPQRTPNDIPSWLSGNVKNNMDSPGTLLPAISASSPTTGTFSVGGNYVPGTRILKQQAKSDSMRDHILQTAHQLYSTNARNPTLIEMLLCLHKLHPQHLPTLLLLACAYFSSNQPEESLKYNELILKIDPNYVEAMSNIGTTLRSMNKTSEAENWWWQAVKLRPGYWDAVENLMGVLCSPLHSKDTNKKSAANSRYHEALELCEFVDKSLHLGDDQSVHGPGTIPKYQVQERQLHRLQSLLYSEGNLRFALGDVAGAKREYEKAMDVVLGGYKLDDLIVRIAYLGAQEGINQMFHQQLHHQMPPSHNLDIKNLPLTLLTPENAVGILQILFPETHGVLPGFCTLANKSLTTGSANQQLQTANQTASNLLLTLAKLHQDHGFVSQPLSVVLPMYYLSLSLVPSPSTCNNLGIILSSIPSPPTSTIVPSLRNVQETAQAPMGSALAMQYYTHGLTLDSRHPHLYTNLGSLLKDLGYLAEAVKMYEKAVEFNPTFDVALANLGNAIKDMGRVQDSVPWYLRAVQASPNFVEAVCGLANAMAGVCDWRARDGLYTEIAAHWRAAALATDDTSEKIFRVMSQGKRPTAKEYAVKLHNMLNYVDGPPSPTLDQPEILDKRRGWMNRVVEIADQQLSDGRQWSKGLFLSGPAQREDLLDGVVRPTDALVRFLANLCKLLPQQPQHRSPPSELASFVHAALKLVQEVHKTCSLSAEESSYSALSREAVKSWRALSQQMRNEGGWAMRLVERAVVVLQRRWYWEVQQNSGISSHNLAKSYKRPQLPTGMVAPLVPTVLPFHTFTYPLDAREIRLISHRNALRLSFTTLGGNAPWLPNHVYGPPPSPASQVLNIGYVSSDFNNHPLSHLMQSVFGMHDRTRFRVFCYATTPPDGTSHRQKIEQEADIFVNCSTWSTQQIVERVAGDQIHVLVNLNGYTKGARNEIFAARPAPVLVAFMGFAGTLGAGWCDYVVTDPIVCPPWTVRCEVRAERARRGKQQHPEMQEVRHNSRSQVKEEMSERSKGLLEEEDQVMTDCNIEQVQKEWNHELEWDFGELDPEEDGMSTGEQRASGNMDEAGAGGWVYTEQMIYMPHTYFVNDHRQGFREDEELRGLQSVDEIWLAEQDARHKMRREIFPHLSDDMFIFANFNQLYKIDPTLFRLWLQILERAPKAIIWLLRFPQAGEEHLLRVAREWSDPSVAQRVVFTDVAPKHLHIKRGRVADAFLDTPECNAHTTAVDILWSGTPVLTWPRHEHKLCSRVAASVACATGHGRQMVVSSADEYVERAVEWAGRASYEYTYTHGSGSRILEADPQTGYVRHRLCHGPAMDLRMQLFLNRDQSRLFDTQRWTRNLERGLEEAWRRWETGEDDMASEADATQGRSRAQWCERIERAIEEKGGRAYAPPGRCIWVCDEDDQMPAHRWLREMMAWSCH